MNLFAFYPSVFKHGGGLFAKFLADRGMELKSEFYIPTALDTLIKNKTIKVRVLKSESKWFGVTYKEDKAIVVEKLNALIDKGVYPSNLWEKNDRI
jgi:hypothetical protein